MTLLRPLVVLMTALSTGTFAPAAPPAVPDPAYLFAYFKNKSDRDGLHLAWSADGLQWHELNGGRSLLAPAVGEEKRMRDPYVHRGPDGTFHLVWTTGWKGQTIGYASSKDLVHWSEQRALALMAGPYPATLNCWAPKISYDDAAGEFLVYWASAVPGQFPDTDPVYSPQSNHRFYVARTKDFATFTKPVIFFDPNHVTIDATIERVGDQFVMFYKGDKLVDGKIVKRIFHATAPAVGGPYAERGEALPHDDTEGPSVCRVGDAYHLYYDYFRRNAYGVSRSTDLKTWTEVTPQLAMPPLASHGRVFPVAGDVVRGLVRRDDARRAAAVAAAPPAVLDGFTADPSIRVFGDRYYLYPTSDKHEWLTTDFSVWSSPDLVAWRRERVILDVTKELAWANIRAWAPDCVERDGRYYFYFSADHKIGVATADNPAGPFADALGRPLVDRKADPRVTTGTIDPYPFVDDDGQAYLYWGNGGERANAFRLKRDMVTIEGDLIDIPIKGRSGGHVVDFREGVVVFKRHGRYYFMWSVDDARSDDYRVAYGTATSPLGPVTIPPDGSLVLRKAGVVTGTGHHSVVNVPGTDRWYVAYHRHAIPDGSGYQRQTCLARMTFAADGSISPIDPMTTPFKPGDIGEPLVNGRGRP